MEERNLKEKVLYGFGDSLVEGHCIGIGMLDALAKKHGMRYHKYARNGATVMPNFESDPDDALRPRVPDIAAQIEAAPDVEPDFVCFDGLTNDVYFHTARERLGRLTDSYDGVYDTATFYGAFERICYLLRMKYRDSRIFYVSVHKMPTRDMEMQEILQRAARQVCEKWSIPVVDIFRQGQINTCMEGMRRAYSYDTAECLTEGNGTHLNATGYEKWYLPMIESAMRKYAL